MASATPASVSTFAKPPPPPTISSVIPIAEMHSSVNFSTCARVYPQRVPSDHDANSTATSSAITGWPMNVAAVSRRLAFGSSSSASVASSISTTGSRIENSVTPKPGAR